MTRCPWATGNFFFAGARLFFRSLEAAIFLFSRVARIPEGSQVLPIICTEERITLGAELLDGSVIRGQHSISHPSAGQVLCTEALFRHSRERSIHLGLYCDLLIFLSEHVLHQKCFRPHPAFLQSCSQESLYAEPQIRAKHFSIAASRLATVLSGTDPSWKHLVCFRRICETCSPSVNKMSCRRMDW